MRCFVMFVTAVCILFLFKLKWPKPGDRRAESESLLKLGQNKLKRRQPSRRHSIIAVNL